MAVMVFTIPESPSWLLHKRLYERADAALAWLGRDQEEFVAEVEIDMQHRLEKVDKDDSKNVKSKYFLLRYYGGKKRDAINMKVAV